MNVSESGRDIASRAYKNVVQIHSQLEESLLKFLLFLLVRTCLYLAFCLVQLSRDFLTFCETTMKTTVEV